MSLQLIPHLHRATHRVGLYIAKCPGAEITQAEAHILAHLHGEGDSTVQQLHQAFGHRRSTLTSILDRLSERKLITRESDAQDRRTFRVRLTPAGSKVGAKAYAWLAALEKEVLSQVSSAQLRAFHSVIKALEHQTANVD